MRLIRASDHPEAQSIPVIAMTANVFVKDVHDALDAGMNAHIAKPLNLETLKSTLGSCLPKNKTAEKIPRNIEQLVRFARDFLTCLHFNTYSALRQSVKLNIFPPIRHNRRSDRRIRHLFGQTFKQPCFSHFTFRQRAEFLNFCRKNHAACAALPVFTARPVIAERLNFKRRRAGFFKQFAFGGLQRRFALLDMTALKFPCRALFMAAEQKFSLHARKDDG